MAINITPKSKKKKPVKNAPKKASDAKVATNKTAKPVKAKKDGKKKGKKKGKKADSKNSGRVRA